MLLPEDRGRLFKSSLHQSTQALNKTLALSIPGVIQCFLINEHDML